MKPDLVLRVSVAGNRKIKSESEIEEGASAVFTALEAVLSAIWEREAKQPGGAGCYSDASPTIRLISGLADGADQIVSEAFLTARSGRIQHSLAAVLPFDVDRYRDRSRIENTVRFERLLAQCTYVLQLDGSLGDPSEPDSRDARSARAAAYRAQSAVLLRQADILFAIEDRQAAGKAGGTRETIHRALSLGVPVVYLPLGEARTMLLRSIDDLEDDERHRSWTEELSAIVRALIEDPILPNGALDQIIRDDESIERRQYERELLREYFSTAKTPRSFRPHLWSAFEKWFGRGPLPASDDIPAPFRPWRERARVLSTYYAGLYRGSFLLAYALAVLAVCLAVGSLIVLVLAPNSEGIAEPAWLILVAFCLGKLTAVLTIQRVVNQANENRWNEKAVDYRYLAERLRSMAYLPNSGSLRALRPRSAKPATRISTQTVIDWLFQAMVRQVSLERIVRTREQSNRIQIDAFSAATAIRDHWIANQARYHARSGDAMQRMSEGFEKAGRAMGLTVVLVVGIDLVILLLGGLDLLPHALSDALHLISPWLLFFAAVLPAAVASVNGLRFQTECARLADRSKQMVRMLAVLKSRADTTIALIDKGRVPAAILPGRTIDVVHLAEDCAQLTLDEVVEWSFVYAKEITEP